MLSSARRALLSSAARPERGDCQGAGPLDAKPLRGPVIELSDAQGRPVEPDRETGSLLNCLFENAIAPQLTIAQTEQS